LDVLTFDAIEIACERDESVLLEAIAAGECRAQER
jgi:hypothetical protein